MASEINERGGRNLRLKIEIEMHRCEDFGESPGMELHAVLVELAERFRVFDLPGPGWSQRICTSTKRNDCGFIAMEYFDRFRESEESERLDAQMHMDDEKLESELERAKEDNNEYLIEWIETRLENLRELREMYDDE